MGKRLARMLVASMMFATVCLAASPCIATAQGNSRKPQVVRHFAPPTHHTRQQKIATPKRGKMGATTLTTDTFSATLDVVPEATVGDTGMTAEEYTVFLDSQSD